MNKKKILQHIVFIAFSMISTSVFAADSVEQIGLKLMNFYQQPSYRSYIDITSKIVTPSSDYTIYDFSSMVLANHPNYVKTIINDFPTFTAPEKKLIFYSLIASDNHDAVETIRKKYNYDTPIKKFHPTEVIANYSEVSDNPIVLDAFWAAYFATGNSIYIERILNYINENDEFLTMGYEIVNRNYLNKVLQKTGLPAKENIEDIKKSLKKRHGNNWQEKFIKVVVISTAISSMESNRQRDPILQRNYENLIKKHPKLDYWKKIKLALGK